MKLPNSLIFTLSTCACLAQAQPLIDAAPELENITVTASRTEMPIRQVGVSVSVLDREAIESLGSLSIADSLRSLPGLAVSNSGGAGKQSSLRIRGEEAYRTKILLDGIEISDSSSTQIQTQLEHYLTADVERIEVLRGPQGMMYGADAGGVVNIITRRGTDGFKGGFNAEYGSFQSSQVAAYFNGRVERVDFALSLTDLATQGFNSRTDDAVGQDRDGYDNLSMAARFGLDISPKWRLETDLRQVEAETEFDACFGLNGTSHDCLSDFRQQNHRLALKYQDEGFTQQLAWQSAATERRNYSDQNPGLAIDGVLDQILYTGTYTFAADKRILFGLDHQSADLDDSSNPHKRNQLGLFAEWQGNLEDRLYYTLGLRQDDNDDFGRHNSVRLSSAYLVDLKNDFLKIKASFGTGFRAPSLYEVAYNQSPFAYPPASLMDLKEEQSRGFDLGFEYVNNSGFELETNYFSQTLENAIEFDLAGYSGYLQRSGKSKANGIELSVRQDLSDNLGLAANYTYTDTRNVNGEQRIRRPDNTLNITLQYRSDDGRLRINLNSRYNSESLDEIYDPVIFNTVRLELAEYVLVNFNVSYELADNIEVYTRVENLLDEHYMEIVNYNVAATAVYGGLRLQF